MPTFSRPSLLSRTALAALLVGLLVAGLVPDPAEAQGPKDSLAQEGPLLDQVRALEFSSLQRGRTTVHFPPGHRERAERLGARSERALTFFSDSLGVELSALHLVLLSEKGWTRLRDRPYGMPHFEENPPTPVLPADAEGVVFDHYLALEDCLPPEHRSRLKRMGRSWEEAAREFVEMITFHEIGHLITASVLPAVERAERGVEWFDEFLAGYFSYAYLHHNEPERARIWRLMSTVNLECYTPKHRTLEQLELVDTNASDYSWYQSSLEQRANRVVERYGFDFIREVQEAFPPRSSPPSDSLWTKADALESGWETLSDQEKRHRLEEINAEILRRLERIALGFQAWAKRFEREEREGG